MSPFLSLLLVLPLQAAATSFSVHPTPLLQPQPGSFYANGIGSPSVFYVPGGGSDGSGGYAMVFETRIAADWLVANRPGNDYTGCSTGAWGLGLAVSDDGVNGWQVLGGEPLFTPEPGSYFECIAAHPNTVYEADAAGGARAHVFFKAERKRPGGGSNLQSGVGLLQLRRTGSWSSLSGWSVAHFDAPVLALDNFGYPAAVQHEGLWYLWVARVPSLYLATRFGNLPDAFTSPGSAPTFNIQPTPVVEPGATVWTPDRVFNPAALCKNNSAFPLTLFLGGKAVDSGGVATTGGWGQAVSADGSAWFTSAEPEFSWTSSNDWRHWDALLVQADADTCDSGPSGSDYLVYFSKFDANGRNQVGFAYTSPSWNKADTRPKVCENNVVGMSVSGHAMSRPAGADGALPEAPALGGYAADGFDTDSATVGCSADNRLLGLGLLAPLGLLLRRRRARATAQR